MKKIDLHETRHAQAEVSVENYVVQCSLTDDYPIEIITGNSDIMRNIVTKVLDRHNFKYRIGDFSGNNMGVIYVFG